MRNYIVMVKDWKNFPFNLFLFLFVVLTIKFSNVTLIGWPMGRLNFVSRYNKQRISAFLILPDVFWAKRSHKLFFFASIDENKMKRKESYLLCSTYLTM